MDLDAAFGRGSNHDLIDTIVGRLDICRSSSPGGIRDAESLDAALSTGCRRVNIGTAALEDPEWTRRSSREHGDRVAIGLDVRGTTLAARGWTREGGDLWETLERLDREGCARYVVTDVNKDGMLQGPNVDLLRRRVRADRPTRRRERRGLDARGHRGVLRALVAEGVEGAIVGSALYRGAFTLPDALDVAGRPSSDHPVRARDDEGGPPTPSARPGRASRSRARLLRRPRRGRSGTRRRAPAVRDRADAARRRPS